ncbi:unnamed protein product [Medioppia subpectinata]|uniref:Uncharacterized protein n=1 Tax=Medioppia subpectinata TaxID=1979941 RepID=A0A7R9L4B8_9ACAR|nr:unnamed protein product [Medioppia subpectinata]CAG2115077.1 unnamed protein product [Medioppia subpectinata]
MMSKILFLAFVAAAYSLPMSNEGNADKLVDQLLEVVKAKYGAQLDPMHLNDSVAAFSKKIGLITFHGDAKLTEGTITGLKNIKRSGECTMTTDKGFDVKVQFGDNNIGAHFKGLLEFMDLHTSGTVEIKIANFDTKVEVITDAAGKLAIKDFQVDELKKVGIVFHGPVEPLDGIVDLLGESFITLFNKQSRDLVGKILKGVVEKELQNLHL